jgi:nucleotide-binding universal stress UspA family protein
MPAEQPDPHTILFATDFSRFSQAAVPYVENIARRYGSRVIVAHVVPPSAFAVVPPEAGSTAFETIIEAARQTLSEFVAGSAIRDLPNTPLLLEGDVPEVLAGVVEESKVDLVVLGTHGRAGLSRLIIGSIAERVLKLVPCPVLIIGPHAPDRLPKGSHLHNILCATDLRHESTSAVDYAVDLSRGHSASLTLLTVLAGNTDINRQALTMTTLTRLRQLTPRTARPEPDTEYVVDYGAVPEVIGQRAENHCDLIVIGGRSPLQPSTYATRPQSIARKIVARAPCPVLSVPECWPLARGSVTRVTSTSAA